jgi:hypothetical protein
MELTEQQINELKRLKSYRPFMIVFGVLRSTGEWETYAKPTMHLANKLTRDGHKVFVVKAT